jgi:hypothetical protein
MASGCSRGTRRSSASSARGRLERRRECRYPFGVRRRAARALAARALSGVRQTPARHRARRRRHHSNTRPSRARGLTPRFGGTGAASRWGGIGEDLTLPVCSSKTLRKLLSAPGRNRTCDSRFRKPLERGDRRRLRDDCAGPTPRGRGDATSRLTLQSSGMRHQLDRR